MEELNIIIKFAVLGSIVILAVFFNTRSVYSDIASQEDIAKLTIKAGENKEAKKIVASFIGQQHQKKSESDSVYDVISVLVEQEEVKRVISEFKTDNKIIKSA